MNEEKNRYKDCTPEETVEKIQDLLRRIGIEVTETWMETVCSSCFSLRIQIKGTGIGQNGKGLSKAFARASAYGEFMERLLTGFLLGGIQTGTQAKFYLAGDERVLERKEIEKLAEANPGWLETLRKTIRGSSNWKILSRCGNELGQKEAWVCLPFIKLPVMQEETPGEKQLEEVNWIPVTLVQAYYASNGASAGNTYEESFVQGFSEIIERHHSLQFFQKDLTPPVVTQEVLQQFPEKWELIKRIQTMEQGRFVVKVYDCSMEEEFPVVAAVLIDRQTHRYGIRFGAHPVFEIALERTLTEMFQGRNLAEAACVETLLTSEKERQDMNCIHNLMKAGTGSIHSGFFSSTPDFKLDLNMIEESKKERSNTELYSQCLSFSQKQNLSLLVRKTQVEGFFAVQILIPGYSEVFAAQGMERLAERNCHNRLKPYLRKGLLGIDQDLLLELITFLWEKVYFAQENTLGYLLGLPLKPEVDSVTGFMNQLVLAYFLRKDEAAVAETLGILVRFLPGKEDQSFYQCLLQTLQILPKEGAQNCREILQQFYPANLVSDCIQGILFFRNYETGKKESELEKLPWLWRKLGFFCSDACQYPVLVKTLEYYSQFMTDISGKKEAEG